jgi:Mg-chelatase subunit ChlI
LQDRAKALAIKGRTGMTADELREAVALEEAKRGTATPATDETQRMGA